MFQNLQIWKEMADPLNKTKELKSMSLIPPFSNVPKLELEYFFDDGSIPTAFTMSGNDWIANSTYAFKGSYS